MKNTRRLLYAFGIFACIYTVSLYVIPRLGFIRSMRAEWSFHRFSCVFNKLRHTTED